MFYTHASIDDLFIDKVQYLHMFMYTYISGVAFIPGRIIIVQGDNRRDMYGKNNVNLLL